MPNHGEGFRKLEKHTRALGPRSLFNLRAVHLAKKEALRKGSERTCSHTSFLTAHGHSKLTGSNCAERWRGCKNQGFSACSGSAIPAAIDTQVVGVHKPQDAVIFLPGEKALACCSFPTEDPAEKQRSEVNGNPKTYTLLVTTVWDSVTETQPDALCKTLAKPCQIPRYGTGF